MTVWDLMNEFISLEGEIQQLMNKKEKTNEKWLDEEIDRKLCKMLEIKHKSQTIQINC